VVKTFREKNDNVLLVDCGNAFVKRRLHETLIAETTIEGMNYIGYDALNIGQGELSVGLDFLRNLEKEASFPFVSANIFLKETGAPLGEQFLIKELDGIKAGITGVISPAFLADNTIVAEHLTIEDPATALKRILPELRKRSDLVILLSHVGEAGTRTLAQKVSGIDIAIVGNDTQVIDQPEKVHDTIILKNSKKGEYIGALHINFDSNGRIFQTKNSVEKISAPIAVDPQAYRMVYEFKKKRAATAIERKKEAERQQMHEELMKQLQTMSPEEFIDKMKKESGNTASPIPLHETSSSTEKQ
jgi:2',3'-cyclic-nucleotide 2'-phosphodiesterase (5'-nucleotidase family)